MKYIFLLLLIVASVGVFVALVIPQYDNVKVTRADVATYESDLAIANQLQAQRQALIAQYNGISKTDLDNITTLLPDNVDDIRLIIQLDSLATKNGLSSLRNVDYNADAVAAATTTTTTNGWTTTTTTTPAAPTADTTSTNNSPYGQFTISFETTGQYSSYLSFLSDVEKNLRLVDITDVDFTTTDPNSTGATSVASGLTYKVTLTTYWLKQ
jgi:Tfp pilus assembly protein PilO